MRISTRDMRHDLILRKLEGRTDRRGIIDILTDSQMTVSDYFIENAYVDASGKSNIVDSISLQYCIDKLKNVYNTL